VTPEPSRAAEAPRRSGVLAPWVLLAVGAGGAVGALARYGSNVALPPPTDTFPLATLLVNVIGAVILGLLSAVPASRLHLQSRVRALVGAGFCGGLTTFSTLSLEIATRWGPVPLVAVAYVAASVAAAPVAVGLGRLIGGRVFPERPWPPVYPGHGPERPSGSP